MTVEAIDTTYKVKGSFIQLLRREHLEIDLLISVQGIMHLDREPPDIILVL